MEERSSAQLFEIECEICGEKLLVERPGNIKYCAECAEQIKRKEGAEALQRKKIRAELNSLKKPQRSIAQICRYAEKHNLTYGKAVVQLEQKKNRKRKDKK